jgi:hypothetical protein
MARLSVVAEIVLALDTLAVFFLAELLKLHRLANAAPDLLIILNCEQCESCKVPIALYKMPRT